jgi:hypothetical protein
MRILSFTLIAWLAAGIAHGQEIVPPPIDAPILSADDKRTLEDRAKSLHQKADAMRNEAETTFTIENDACWQKFLVSDCQKSAKKAKTARMMEASAVEREAREIDRQLRKSNFAEQQAKKAEEGPQRAADAAEQAAKNRQAREEAMARVEKKRQEAEQRGK